MRAQLRKAWEARSPRERAVIQVLALLLGIALYGWLVQSAVRARVQLRTSVAVLQTQAATVAQQAAEYERLRAAPAISASPTDLRTLVQSQAGAAGLARALVRIDAQDADQVVAVFGAVAFADWLSWIAGLKLQQVRLDACRIEALSTPGLVSITATLVRAKPQ
jgi:general secretion pathway protein M